MRGQYLCETLSLSVPREYGLPVGIVPLTFHWPKLLSGRHHWTETILSAFQRDKAAGDGAEERLSPLTIRNPRKTNGAAGFPNPSFYLHSPWESR